MVEPHERVGRATEASLICRGLLQQPEQLNHLAERLS